MHNLQIRSLACIRVAKLKIISIALLTIIWSAPANAQEYCYNSVCYTSLAEAEGVMRAENGVAGQYMEAWRAYVRQLSNYDWSIDYAVDIKQLDFNGPYAIARAGYTDGCVSNFPTPFHADWCNTLQEAADAWEAGLLAFPAICDAMITPVNVDYTMYPAAGQPWLDDREWFANFLGLPESVVTIRQFQNPCIGYQTAYDQNNNCTDQHILCDGTLPGNSFTVMEYGYCPVGTYDTYHDKSPVSGNIERPYPYECGAPSITGRIDVKGALPNPSCGPNEGNPCDPTTGNKKISTTDFEHSTLPLSRHYHSLGLGQDIADMGRGWNHNYAVKFQKMAVSQTGSIITLPDGTIAAFEDPGSSTIHVSHQLTNALFHELSSTMGELRFSNGDVWTFEGGSQLVGLYLTKMEFADDTSRNLTIVRDSIGLVTDVIDQAGRSLHFNYEGGDLTSVTTPDGSQINYVYEPVGFSDTKRLVRVIYQDGKFIEYQYSDTNHPYHVTGIIDELGNQFASYTYDTKGRVLTSQHAGGAGAVSLSYGGSTTSVTSPLGDARTYYNSSYGGWASRWFPSYNSIVDGQGTHSIQWRSALPRRKESETDREGNTTAYQYDQYSRLKSMNRPGYSGDSFV